MWGRLKAGRKMVVETFGPRQTRDLGERLGRIARPGQVFALSGDLGAGKTVFAQGLAAGLGIAGPVCSPTFTILQVYEGGRLPFYHFDAYRIETVDGMEEIGAEEFFYGEGVCLVEWADLVREILPADAVWVRICRVPEKGDLYREIALEGFDPRNADGQRSGATWEGKLPAQGGGRNLK